MSDLINGLVDAADASMERRALKQPSNQPYLSFVKAISEEFGLNTAYLGLGNEISQTNSRQHHFDDIHNI
jgi:Mor family transcriptional regulator